MEDGIGHLKSISNNRHSVNTDRNLPFLLHIEEIVFKCVLSLCFLVAIARLGVMENGAVWFNILMNSTSIAGSRLTDRLFVSPDYKSMSYLVVPVIIICLELEDLRRVMYRAQKMGMTGGDYVYLYYTLILSKEMKQPWEDGRVMTTEQQANRIDAFRQLKQVYLSVSLSLPLPRSIPLINSFLKMKIAFASNSYVGNSYS